MGPLEVCSMKDEIPKRPKDCGHRDKSSLAQIDKGAR